MAVFLLFGPYLANLSTPSELFGRHWRTRDAVFLLATMAGLALLCLLTRALIRRLRLRLPLRLFDHLFVVAVGAGLLANLAFYVPAITKQGMPMETAWLVLIAFAAYSLAARGSQLVLRARQLCVMLSPLLLILPVHLLRFDTYPSDPDPFPSKVAERSAGSSQRDSIPVYVFVFDMWSYAQSFDDGEVRPILPNLLALSKRSIMFHEAHAPGPGTVESMPRLLFDTDLEVVRRAGRVGFNHDGAFIAPSELGSLFSTASANAYRTFFVGFSLPYRLWLGDEVDVVRSYHWCQQHPGDGPLATAAMHTARAMRYWTDPWARTFHARYHLALDGLWGIKVHEAITRDVLHCLREEPRNTLAVIHHPLPHYPYILDGEGGYRKPLDVEWNYEDPYEYEQALVCMDKAVGVFVSAMKQAGRFDDALLILTSDHAWKWNPDRTSGRLRSPLTHVPLIVKLPRQQRPLRVAAHFETRGMSAIIDRAIDPAADTADIDGFLTEVLADRGALQPATNLATR